MPHLASDFRDAVRALRRRPGFTALAVSTLAVGMAVNTLAFSVVNAVLFKRPSFAQEERLGWIFLGRNARALDEASLPDYERLRDRARTLDALVAEGRLPLRLREGARSDQVWSLVVSPNYFSVLGARAEAGRLLAEGDARQPVVVVSHAFWKARLNGQAPGTATVRLNDQPFAVIGVLPAGFQGPGGIYSPEVWVSLEARDLLALPARTREADSTWLTLVGRARAGVDGRQVSAELTALVQGEPEGSGAARRIARFAPMPEGHPEQRALGLAGAIAMGVVGLVLLIACFNVAGLLTARAAERRREMAVRSALGASGWHLVRQLGAEALVLASLAGVLALAFSALAEPLLSSFSLPAPIPQRIDLSPDARSVLFTLSLVLVAALVPALLPARHATRLDLQQVLASEAASTTPGGRRSGVRRAFQVLQIAGSTMFLALAALFVISFHAMMSSDPGFETERVLVATADAQVHGRAPEATETFFRTLADRLRADGRVRQAGLASSIPYSVGASRSTTVGVNGQDCRATRCEAAELFVVDGGYVEAMSIPLVSGRGLREQDRRAGGGVLVSRSAADTFWPGRTPIGQMVSLGPAGEPAEVVGVVGDVGASGLGRQPRPQVYRAIRGTDFSEAVTLVVGTRGDPGALAAPLRMAASALDANLPLQAVETMDQHLALPLWPGRVAAWFLGVCGAVALLLASVGLFGVISYAVAQRVPEFGVRLALGASPARILRMVLGEGAALTAAGAAIGLVAAAGAGFLVRAALVGVAVTDAGPYLAAVGVQALVAIVACAQPARRAARIEPIAVMKSPGL